MIVVAYSTVIMLYVNFDVGLHYLYTFLFIKSGYTFFTKTDYTQKQNPFPPSHLTVAPSSVPLK